MNFKKYILIACLPLLVLTACEKDLSGDTDFLETGAAPDSLSVMFDITQDNTGKVTITPNGNGVTSYDIFFGDATTTPANLQPGRSAQHTYAEGAYTVKVVAHGIGGQTTELTKPLTVTFRAPENLEVTSAIDPANNFKLNVSATALYETNFRVTFGDVPNEIPRSFLEGETVNHVYATTGT
ncbi:MAG: PKD domain protein, partial [Chitinophagaceae bacterium]